MEPNYELEDTLFEEPILWKYSPTKYRKLSNELLYASIVPAACLLAGVILALTDIILWIGLLMFGGTAVITFLIILFKIPKQARPVYAITETKIIIYPFMPIADFANINKIIKKGSPINGKLGTIKFKLKKNFSSNYRFSNIEDVDTVYDLLISLWTKYI